MMTKYALANFAKDESNALIHLSSILGDFGLPFYAVYSGTKTFNRVFGMLTHYTKAGNTPDTLIVKPSKTSTQMIDYARDSTSVEPVEVVHGMCKELGLKSYAETNGAWAHNVQGASFRYFPKPVQHLMKS